MYVRAHLVLRALFSAGTIQLQLSKDVALSTPLLGLLALCGEFKAVQELDPAAISTLIVPAAVLRCTTTAKYNSRLPKGKEDHTDGVT